jgi:hypothetical protein
MRDLILSGKASSLPRAERTVGQQSKRAVVEGHSQLQCKACQGTQVIVEKSF